MATTGLHEDEQGLEVEVCQVRADSDPESEDCGQQQYEQRDAIEEQAPPAPQLGPWAATEQRTEDTPKRTDAMTGLSNPRSAWT